MPGDDDEHRILCSLVALLAFLELGAREHTTSFTPHLARLLAFLARSTAQPSCAPWREGVEQVLARMDEIAAADRVWLLKLDGIAADSSRQKRAEMWQMLRRVVR